MAKKKLPKDTMADKLLEKFDKENTSIEPSTMDELETGRFLPSQPESHQEEHRQGELMADQESSECSDPQADVSVHPGRHRRSKGASHKELRTRHVSLLLGESLVESLRNRADEAELSLNRYIEKVLLNSLKS